MVFKWCNHQTPFFKIFNFCFNVFLEENMNIRKNELLKFLSLLKQLLIMEEDFDEKKLLEKIGIENDPDVEKNKKSKSWMFAIMWFKGEFIDVLVFITEKYIYIRPLQIQKSFEFEMLFNFGLESKDFDNKRMIKIKHKDFPLHPWAHLYNRTNVYDHLIKKEFYSELINKYNL